MSARKMNRRSFNQWKMPHKHTKHTKHRRTAYTHRHKYYEHVTHACVVCAVNRACSMRLLSLYYIRGCIYSLFRQMKIVDSFSRPSTTHRELTSSIVCCLCNIGARASKRRQAHTRERDRKWIWTCDRDSTAIVSKHRLELEYL